MQEAWEWDVENYKLEFDDKSRISPNDYKKMKMPFRKLLTRSIFLRLIFVLQTAHVSHNLRYSFNTLCWRTVHEASGMDGFWMGLYLRAPKFLKNRFYNLYSKKMKSL